MINDEAYDVTKTEKRRESKLITVLFCPGWIVLESLRSQPQARCSCKTRGRLSSQNQERWAQRTWSHSPHLKRHLLPQNQNQQKPSKILALVQIPKLKRKVKVISLTQKAHHLTTRPQAIVLP